MEEVGTSGSCRRRSQTTDLVPRLCLLLLLCFILLFCYRCCFQIETNSQRNLALLSYPIRRDPSRTPGKRNQGKRQRHKQRHQLRRRHRQS